MGFLDDLLGKTAAKTSNAAAQDTFSKQQAATSGLNTYADTLPGQYKSLGQGYDQYSQAGGGALAQLMSGLGLNGQGGQEQFTQAYHNLPGYQAGLNTGTDAVTRGANSGNMLNSGSTLKALQRFGSDYEDQRSGDYLNRLSGLSGMGLQATGAQAGLGAQGLGQQAGLRQSAFGGQMNSAGTVGQGMVAGEQAKSSALTNLMSTAAYLGGAALGGGFGKPPSGSGGISPFGAGIGPFKA